MSNDRSARPSDSTTMGMSWLRTPLLPLKCNRPVAHASATARLRKEECHADVRPPRDRVPRAPRVGLAGAHRGTAPRGVVRERGRARRPSRRLGRLPLGRRQRARGDRRGGRSGAPARLPLARHRGRRARDARRAHARGGRSWNAPGRHRDARGIGRMGPGPRPPRLGGLRVRIVPLDPPEGVFGALSDPNRRRMLDVLSERDATATELAAELPVTRQAVSKHLATLRDAGLVEGERQGRETRYRLRPEPLAEAMTWMARVGAEWDARLDSLERLLRSRDDR